MMRHANPCRVAVALVALCAAAASACSGPDRPAYAKTASDSPEGIAIIDPPTAPYVAAPIAMPGAIVGTVTFAGDRPDDPRITVTRDATVCAAAAKQSRISVSGDKLSGALVWIEGIRTGRQLPLAKRFELTQDGCVLDPLVQPVVTGGVLNVRNDDPIIVRSAVVNARTLDTLVVLRFTDEGEVVPLDRQLGRPGLLAVVSTTHPWMRAWVGVFDHPYFAQSAADGGFRMEGVPPGRVRIKAWHPSFGTATAVVTVAAGATDSIQIRFVPDTSSVAGVPRPR